MTKPKTKWIVCSWKNGSFMVLDRETKEVIGSIIPYFQRSWMATVADTGEERDKFTTRFDACSWLYKKFENR